MKNKKYKYLGVIHIHTKFSDGTGSIETISKAAKKAGLQWIIITDHNSMEIEEGYYNGVCVIKGEEITPKNANHYLALDVKTTITPSENPADNIQQVINQGGFGYSAHPDESSKRKNKYKELVWTDKSIYYSGIEIWNWFSSWADGFNDKNFFTQLYGYIFKNKILQEPKAETIDWWDKVNNQERKIINGIFGTDAHALKYKKYIFPVLVFPYTFMFKTLANIILLEDELSSDFEVAKSQILSALRYGKNYMINRQRFDRHDFDFYIKNDNGVAFCGEEIKLQENTHLYLSLPFKADIKVLRNGETIEKTFSDYIQYKIIQSGKYRIEVRNKGKVCMLSNPILVR